MANALRVWSMAHRWLLFRGAAIGVASGMISWVGLQVFNAAIDYRMQWVIAGLYCLAGLGTGLWMCQVRQKLAESEDRFHAFMNNAAVVAYLKDTAGRFVYVNDTYARLRRIARDKVLGKTNEEIFSPEIAGPIVENDRVVLESNKGREFTEDVPDHSGNLRNWISCKFPLHSRSGEVFLGGVSIEITEIMRTQQALRESEARYRQIVEYAGDIIVRCDARGRISYVNEMGVRVLKTSPARVRGRRALSLTTPRERRRILGILRDEIGAGRFDLYLEVPLIREDGSEIWLGQTLRILHSGRLVSGFQAISRDISQRRKVEADLRASEERFRLLYENGPVAYHEIDRQGVIRRVNRAECEMFGLTAEELVGRVVVDFMAPEDREIARAAIAAKIAEQLPLRPFQRTFLRRDGRAVRVEIHENLLRDAAGVVVGIHSVLLDVTQRHLSELLDRDRRETSEMIAQQQPLERILQGVSRMISHQDEKLFCVPLWMSSEEEERRMEPVGDGGVSEALAQALGQLGQEAVRIWPMEGFRVSSREVGDLAEGPASVVFAERAARLGMQSCWSIPMVSSTRSSLGVLLVFSPRGGEPSQAENQLLEAASRLAAIAIEHRFMTDLLAFQAGHDSLTRLPNRSTFESRLERSIVMAEARDEQLAIFYVDLDHFKAVNDTFGHGGGDELLRQVASRLRRCVRRGDTIARVGGDEFSLLLPGMGAVSDANRVAETILQDFKRPFEIAGTEVSITPSIGISFYPRDGVDATTLQRNSDSAMYRAKNAGKNGFRCHSAGSRARLERRAARSGVRRESQVVRPLDGAGIRDDLAELQQARAWPSAITGLSLDAGGPAGAHLEGGLSEVSKRRDQEYAVD